MLFYFSDCTPLRLGKRTLDHEKGQGLLEYGLIILLIVIVIITAASLFGDEVKTLYITIVDQLAIWLS